MKRRRRKRRRREKKEEEKKEEWKNEVESTHESNTMLAYRRALSLTSSHCKIHSCAHFTNYINTKGEERPGSGRGRGGRERKGKGREVKDKEHTSLEKERMVWKKGDFSFLSQFLLSNS